MAWVTFGRDEFRCLPHGVACVYALYSDRELLYIGKTQNAYGRFNGSHRFKVGVTRMKAKAVEPALLDYHEQRLIQRLRPRMNVQHTGRSAWTRGQMFSVRATSPWVRR